jgi:hypothetical protein
MESRTLDQFRGKLFGFITTSSLESCESCRQAAVVGFGPCFFLFLKGGFGFVLFF